MLKIITLSAILSLGTFICAPAVSANTPMEFEQDVIPTAGGDLSIYFVGHGSLIFNYAGKTIYVDPYSKLADYSLLPKADAVVITHEHQDHFDLTALESILRDDTVIVLNAKSAELLSGRKGKILKNGGTTKIFDIGIKAVPAYNIVHKRENNVPFHPPGDGNGYVLTFGDKRLYLAGDTEVIPEMTELKNINIAFLPMSLPFTMTPEMVKEAALIIQPQILYPYHYGSTDTNKFLALMDGTDSMEIRIRKMQ